MPADVRERERAGALSARGVRGPGAGLLQRQLLPSEGLRRRRRRRLTREPTSSAPPTGRSYGGSSLLVSPT